MSGIHLEQRKNPRRKENTKATNTIITQSATPSKHLPPSQRHCYKSFTRTLSNFIDFCNCWTSGIRLPCSKPETIRLFAKFFRAFRFAAEAMPWEPEALKV